MYTYYRTCLDEIKRLELFVQLCWSGLDFASNASRVIEVLEERYLSEGRDLQKEYDRAKQLETFAQEQTVVGFSYSYNLASIRLWSIIEAFIEEFMISFIIEDNEIGSKDMFKKLKGPLIEFVSLSQEDRAEYLLYMLKQELRSEFKLGVQKFETLLKSINFDGFVEEEVARNFFELSQIRNVLVHRNGRADSRLIGNCPWLGYSLDDEIHLTVHDLNRYIMSAHWYILEISKRSIGRFNDEDGASAESHERVQVDLATSLREVAAAHQHILR